MRTCMSSFMQCEFHYWRTHSFLSNLPREQSANIQTLAVFHWPKELTFLRPKNKVSCIELIEFFTKLRSCPDRKVLKWLDWAEPNKPPMPCFFLVKKKKHYYFTLISSTENRHLIWHFQKNFSDYEQMPSFNLLFTLSSCHQSRQQMSKNVIFVAGSSTEAPGRHRHSEEAICWQMGFGAGLQQHLLVGFIGWRSTISWRFSPPCLSGRVDNVTKSRRNLVTQRCC